MRVILPPHSKFHVNGTICGWVIAKKWFSMRNPSAILNLWISAFCHVSVAWGEICVCLLNFAKIGRFAAEIWRYSDYQNGAVRHVGYSKLEFSSPNLRMRAMVPPHSNFISIGQYAAEFWPKMIFNMASVHHLEFLNFSHVSVASVKICVRVAYSDDSRMRYGDITIFKMAAVRHVGFIVTSSYCTGRLSWTLLTFC